MLVLAQYVHPSKLGLFRIVQHGRRWRVLIDDLEAGRYDSLEEALSTARQALPHARLPERLEQWRYLPQMPLAHSRLSLAGGQAAWVDYERAA